MDGTNKRKKVLSPVETGGENGKEKRTYWMRVGTAFVNKDDSINVYLDAMPKTMKLQVRDFDERDLRPQAQHDRDDRTLGEGVPF